MRFILGGIFMLLLSVDIMADRGFDVILKEMKSEPRVALVIGNKDYSSLNSLKNPINDARDMADILRKKGFYVIPLENASQFQMEQAITQFSNKIRSGKGVGLFYYAGHGVEFEGINYLIPSNVTGLTPDFVKSKTVSVDSIITAMERANNRFNILILDACRSKPWGRGGGGLAPINSATGIYVAYATAPGKIAEDGAGRNGLFTGYLKKYINQSGLKIEEVFKNVRREVRKASHKRQTPWTSSSVDGDFYFSLSNHLNIPNNRPINPPFINSNIQVINYSNGNKYEGEIRNGKRDGKGTFTFTNGEKYIGEWKNDKRNGQGINTYKNGDKYVGEFKNGKKAGEGTFTFGNGEKYIGAFKNDKREGKGTFTFSNKEEYIGEWKNDKYSGKGIFTYIDGRKDKGIWKNNKLIQREY